MSKDAIDLLKEDHDHVRRLLTQLSETTSRAAKTRGDLLKKIGSEILVHTKLEEEIFYPAFRDANGAKHAKNYQMRMRSSGALHIRSPGRVPNASWKASRCCTIPLVRYSPGL